MLDLTLKRRSLFEMFIYSAKDPNHRNSNVSKGLIDQSKGSLTPSISKISSHTNNKKFAINPSLSKKSLNYKPYSGISQI